MEKEEKVKVSQLLWEFEKEAMLKSSREIYQSLIEVLDPLFKSGIVTYDEWVERVSDTFSKHALNYEGDRAKVVKKVWEEIIDYYKQLN